MNYFLGMFFLWVVYYPILTILKVLLFFVPKVRERFRFERKNKQEIGARSFNKDQIVADLCFEFSSEGEYQQIASLVEDALLLGKKLELVFFSPSVEKTIVELWNRYPDQIRYFRYPILSLGFSSWITSKTLVLVRYDLFPEFLIWSLRTDRKLKFLWVTFKKERLLGQGIPLVKKAFLMKSSYSVFATQADADQASGLGFRGPVFDFRMEQILRRNEIRLDTFSKLFALYPDFKATLDQYPRNKRLIMGNAWPEDLKLLTSIPDDVLLVIVPHKLHPEMLESFQSVLKSLGRAAEMISDGTTVMPKAKTFLINKKGILCELYQDFGKAYVGGGFGASVHSLLEPLVGGCDSISCGPVNQRSTEFDLAQQLGHLKEVKNSQEFQIWLGQDVSTPELHAKLMKQTKMYADFKKDLLSC